MRGEVEVSVPVERLPHGADLPLPAYATPGSAGLDLLAAVDGAVEVAPGARELVPTGLRLALPDGWEGQVRPRSGLALRHGVTVLNAPGTIDADYRGEVGVVLANLGAEPFVVTRGMRIAQLVIAPVARVAWVERGIEKTGIEKRGARGAGGFGSTGVGADPGERGA